MTETPNRSASADILAKASRPWLLYFFAPFLLLSVTASLFAGHYGLFFCKLLGFGGLYLSIRWMERGIEESLRYEHAAIAKAPKIPWKIAGSLALFATVLFLGITTVEASWWESLIVASVTAGGALLYYGTDPVRDKLPRTTGDVNPEHLFRNLREAEERVAEIEKGGRRIEDPELAEALGKTLHRAHAILETIRSDPRDIRVARKFLVVYLDGVADVIRQYHTVKAEQIDPPMRRRLIELLQEAARRFDEELERLRSNDLFELDVQIDALREQLKH
ncbi:5-bromo-4-chloroindolyl phosphate hydrolysis family protein [Hydrogenimonas sp.]